MSHYSHLKFTTWTSLHILKIPPIHFFLVMFLHYYQMFDKLSIDVTLYNFNLIDTTLYMINKSMLKCQSISKCLYYSNTVHVMLTKKMDLSSQRSLKVDPTDKEEVIPRIKRKINSNTQIGDTWQNEFQLRLHNCLHNVLQSSIQRPRSYMLYSQDLYIKRCLLPLNTSSLALSISQYPTLVSFLPKWLSVLASTRSPSTFPTKALEGSDLRCTYLYPN